MVLQTALMEFLIVAFPCLVRGSKEIILISFFVLCSKLLVLVVSLTPIPVNEDITHVCNLKL
mgnify:CR=1 FL=1